MDKKSATTTEAAPAVVKATTHLEEVDREPKDDMEKHKRNVNEKEQSDTKEILQGSDEVAAAVKTGSVQSEAESSSSDDDEPSKKKAKADTDEDTPKKENPSDNFIEGSDVKESDNPFFGDLGPSLFVGGRYSGGRCGGRKKCTYRKRTC